MGHSCKTVLLSGSCEDALVGHSRGTLLGSHHSSRSPATRRVYTRMLLADALSTKAATSQSKFCRPVCHTLDTTVWRQATWTPPSCPHCTNHIVASCEPELPQASSRTTSGFSTPATHFANFHLELQLARNVCFTSLWSTDPERSPPQSPQRCPKRRED